ncbi:MAG: hypothetical protein AB1465_04250 [Patescibacteria group bacterium]
MINKYILGQEEGGATFLNITLNQEAFSDKIAAAYLNLPNLRDNYLVFRKNREQWFCNVKIWQNI